MKSSTHCVCGWHRPLIALVNTRGRDTDRAIVPAYKCPECGEPYISSPVSPEAERAIFELLAAIDAVKAPTKPRGPAS